MRIEPRILPTPRLDDALKPIVSSEASTSAGIRVIEWGLRCASVRRHVRVRRTRGPTNGIVSSRYAFVLADQESRRPIVRLNTSAPGLLLLSTQK